MKANFKRPTRNFLKGPLSLKIKLKNIFETNIVNNFCCIMLFKMLANFETYEVKDGPVLAPLNPLLHMT